MMSEYHKTLQAMNRLNDLLGTHVPSHAQTAEAGNDIMQVFALLEDYKRKTDQLEQAEARVAELEAEQQLAKGTLLCPKWAKAQVLRKQAEAVDAAADALALQGFCMSVHDLRLRAQRLRQQADELEQ